MAPAPVNELYKEFVPSAPGTCKVQKPPGRRVFKLRWPDGVVPTGRISDAEVKEWAQGYPEGAAFVTEPTEQFEYLASAQRPDVAFGLRIWPKGYNKKGHRGKGNVTVYLKKMEVEVHGKPEAMDKLCRQVDAWTAPL